MRGAERDGPLVTDLASEGIGLGKAQMMGMAGGTAADDTGL